MRQMALSAFLMPGGYDRRAWRHADSPAEHLGELAPIVEITQAFEAAKLDAVFIADVISGSWILEGDVFMGNPYEPLSALAALASVTERIGLIGTFSTTWNHPYTLARQLQALDVLSAGRAGWNIVTSGGAGDHYGMPLPSKDDRYRRAEEVVPVMQELWNAWSDEAVIADRATGNWVDPSLIRPVDFEGEFVKVAGILNQRRSPQGHPVLVQAGQSVGGLRLGAAVAEVVYTVQPVLSESVQYYAAYKKRLAEIGRDPDQTKILPGLVPFIAETEAEAQELFHSMDDFVDLEAKRNEFATRNGINLDDLDLDESIPAERFDAVIGDAGGSRLVAYRQMSVDGGATLRRVLLDSAASGGHLVTVGTASQIADTMIEWFDGRACDGFSINAPLVPSTVRGICDLLVPELQERGYFRTEYTGTTLREHLGLEHPLAWDKQ